MSLKTKVNGVEKTLAELKDVPAYSKKAATANSPVIDTTCVCRLGKIAVIHINGNTTRDMKAKTSNWIMKLDGPYEPDYKVWSYPIAQDAGYIRILSDSENGYYVEFIPFNDFPKGSALMGDITYICRGD